jgi:hypothetical protein
MTNTRRYEKCLVRSTKWGKTIYPAFKNVQKKTAVKKPKSWWRAGERKRKVGAAVRHLFFLFLKKRDGQLFSLEEMGSLLPTTTSSFESPQSAWMACWCLTTCLFSLSALPVPYNIHLLFIFLKRPYNKRMSLLRDEQHVNDVTSGRDGRDIPKEKKMKDRESTEPFFFLFDLSS